MMGIRAATYLQVKADFWMGDRVRSAKVVRATQKAPGDAQLPGTVLVKITLDIPENAFLPLRPEAIVTIPADFAIAKAIEVVAEDPRPDDD
jgi:hypothetical protein